MSRSIGGALPPGALTRLSQADLPAHLDRVLPLITVDPEGRPHPMLLSSLEVRAVDARTLRVVLGAGSRSAENLAARHLATLLLVEPEQTLYVKLRAAAAPRPVPGLPDAVLVVLEVEDVLLDHPAEWEAGTRLTDGIRYAPVPSLDEPRARATLRALAASSPR